MFLYITIISCRRRLCLEKYKKNQIDISSLNLLISIEWIVDTFEHMTINNIWYSIEIFGFVCGQHFLWLFSRVNHYIVLSNVYCTARVGTVQTVWTSSTSVWDVDHPSLCWHAPSYHVLVHRYVPTQQIFNTGPVPEMTNPGLKQREHDIFSLYHV